jgi:uncharacterized protein (DUF885 family)
MDAFTLGDALLDDYLELSPVTSTMVGMPGRDHLWDDLSPEGIEKARSMALRYRTQLLELGEPAERWEQLAWRVALALVEEWLDLFEHGDPFRDLNNIASPFQHVRDVLDIQDTSSWEPLITRLATFGQPLSGYRETLEKGRQMGVLASKRQAEAVIAQAKVLAGNDSPLHRFAADLADSALATPESTASMESAISAAKLAAGEFAAYLESTYLPDALGADGVGADRYARATRRFLGMQIDPEATYRWGWGQLAELRQQMLETSMLIDPSKSLDDVVDLLTTDPNRCAHSKEEFVAFMSERLNVAVHELDGTTFDIPEPVKSVDVKIAPPGGALGAYYMQPSEDFSRPGSVWWSTGDKRAFPLWDEVSTAYHEGFPGHHLQCGIAMTLGDHLSRLHRLLIWYPGYGEGWALYTELLMNELGYLEKPEYVLGMLGAQMLRACRVAIDIGSHLDLPIPDDAPFHPGERWTFELAVELLTGFAFLADDYARSEVTRYLGWPGQAISYKVGERAILELREEFLGQGGDLKEFHSRVLGSGAVGLDLLRDLVLK